MDSKCRTYKGDSKLPGILDNKEAKISSLLGSYKKTQLTQKDGGCEKWVVITTINPPTKTMEVLEKVGGFLNCYDLEPFPSSVT